MDIRKIKKLIELLEESGIAEIEIKEGEEAVRISRMPAAGTVPVYPQFTHVAASLPMPAQLEAQPKAAAPAAELPPAKPKVNEHVITAPMVGTFYSAPSPGAKAFVDLCRRFETKYGARFKPGKLLVEMAEKGESFYGRFAPPKAKAA